MCKYKITKDIKHDLIGTILGYQLELKIISHIYKNTIKILKKEKNMGVDSKFLKYLEYRMISSNIINIVSTWEQQLFLFINDKFDKSILNKYDIIRDESYINKLDIDKKLFDELSVYRELTNALKHGTGTSYDKLKDKKTKYTDYPAQFIELINSPAFNIPVLNLDETDVENIRQKFYDFWSCIILEIEKKTT